MESMRIQCWNVEQVAEQGTDQPITLYYAVTRAADLVAGQAVDTIKEGHELRRPVGWRAR